MPSTVIETIRSHLAGLSLRRVQTSNKRAAAVLMPIFFRHGELYFLLTLRTEEVRTHKGQISFPGGMVRDGEDPLEAALRETFEEVGIERSSIEILGQFHDYVSITGFRVVTIAGFISANFFPRLQPAEVAAVLEVPFAIFRDPSLFRIERMVRDGKEVPVYFYTFGRHEIWGLTARIIKDFLDEVWIEGIAPAGGAIPSR